MGFNETLKLKLKEKGLDLAEEVAEDIVVSVFETAEEVIKESSNKVDDLFLPVIGLVKPKVLGLIDKIDGEVG